MAAVRDLPTVSLVYASNLYSDEKCFEPGETYTAMLTIAPLTDKAGVVLMRGQTHCGFLKPSCEDDALAYLQRGFTVKVRVHRCSGPSSSPAYNHELRIWQHQSQGQGSCWAEAAHSSGFDTPVRISLGEIKIDYGTGEFGPLQESCFRLGCTYVLNRARGAGVAVELDRPEKQCGFVTRDTSQKVIQRLDRGYPLQVKIVQVTQGNQQEWDPDMKRCRDWWHGVGECFFERR